MPYIVGLATGLKLSYESLEVEATRLTALRDRLVDGVLGEIPDVRLTGHPTRRLANSASFVFQGIDGESILMQLDLKGVSASSGSACASGEEEPSHVLSAMGIDARLALGSLRLTLGRENSADDVDYVLSVLPGIVEKLRIMSPVYVANATP